MKMVKIKTSQATPIQLAWLTAKLEDWSEKVFVHPDFPYVGGPMGKWDPAQDWRQGGLIIEREAIGIGCLGKSAIYANPWLAARTEDNTEYAGPTPLIAACLCFVASRLGEEVEVPEILL